MDFKFNIDDVIGLLGLKSSNNNKSYNNYNLDECPFCRSKKKMNINRVNNTFHCSKCDEGGGMLDLYIKLTEVSNYKQAMYQICQNLGLNNNKENTIIKKIEIKKEEIKEETIERENWDIEKIDIAYVKLLNFLNLNEADYDSLINRGLTDEDIKIAMYRSTPSEEEAAQIVSELKKQKIDLEGVPGFYVDEYEMCWKFNTKVQGLIIPIKNNEQKITGIQIRTNNKDCKYMALSSGNYKMGKKSNTFINYPKMITAESKVYITEGVIKSNVATALSNSDNVIFLGLQGVANQKYIPDLIKILKEKNIKKVFLALDMDKFENIYVMKAECKLKQTFEESHIEVKIINWDKKYKGIDDFALYQKEKNTVEKKVEEKKEEEEKHIEIPFEVFEEEEKQNQKDQEDILFWDIDWPLIFLADSPLKNLLYF